jgi:hypothetical protein
MRIDIVHPLARVGNTGNRTTALRLARMLGPHHAVRVRPRWRHGHSDVLIALHALRSQASIAAWKRAHPRGRLIVVLTGTDIYGAGAADARTQASLEHAWRIVALQADAAARVPADLQAKTRVILQSAVLPP